ncbi:CvfB family protein [Micavibrio aeruginosavorus]|nr:S1-like domain-containing RNA-binding protein [Micavibrio aeruginosavorus]
MLSIGKTAQLEIIKEVDFGLYLDGEHFGEILLPARYVPDNCKVGDWLDVFLYLDSEDTIIATTEQPFAEMGECAYLEAVDSNSYGTFLDWGLSKDLFAPFKEQRAPMEIGKSYVVYIFEDKSGRISASSKLDNFLNEYADGYFIDNQAVDLLIASRSPLGYKAVIDGTHLGLIHNNDVITPIHVGQEIIGYIKDIRPDGAIDLALQQQGAQMRGTLTQQILADLKKNGGASTLTDKSPPEEIFKRYQVSKANYKKAIGQLYKDKKIILGKDKITLPK